MNQSVNTASWWRRIVSRTRGSQHSLSISDRALTLRIYSALEDLDLEAVESLSVYVREGRVTVFGLVSSPRDRNFVLDMVARVPGVAGVEDHVQVVDPGEVSIDILTPFV